MRRSARTKKPIVKEPIVDESSTESEAEAVSESESEIESESGSESADITDPSDDDYEKEREREKAKKEKKKEKDGERKGSKKQQGEELHINLPLPRGLSDTGAGVSAPKNSEGVPTVRSKGTLGRLTQEAQQSSGKDLLGKGTTKVVAHDGPSPLSS